MFVQMLFFIFYLYQKKRSDSLQVTSEFFYKIVNWVRSESARCRGDGAGYGHGQVGRDVFAYGHAGKRACRCQQSRGSPRRAHELFADLYALQPHPAQTS
ncbi:hypothetical protein AYI69_g10477 [Smittium culicis]|uniref:Uncharacterized protein n=1 Tax=Smittium culicis TaxID=133412 RepID=A0A1R1X5L3_9FUNG|nr:hypothetical protein AYI69_g10477 [Smittium culicis]